MGMAFPEIKAQEFLIGNVIKEEESSFLRTLDQGLLLLDKVIENTISRSAKAFNLKSDPDTNIRVLLALAYRANYGDAAFDRLKVNCSLYTKRYVQVGTELVQHVFMLVNVKGATYPLTLRT